MHEGIDFSAIIEQSIVSPLDGRATNRIGPGTKAPLVDIYPLKVRPEFDYIQILYVNKPEGIQNNVARLVKAGEPIGTAANLQDLNYPENVGPHVHVQLWKGKNKIDPTPFFKI